MSTVPYNPDDLPFLGGQSPIAEIFPFRTVMPAIYVAGCNLRCLYCLNRDLVKEECPKLDAAAIALEMRNALEPWIMVSGAEALTNPKTPNLLYYLKKLGFCTVLATNGAYFTTLKRVVEDGLVDHVAIDVKAPLVLDRYREISPVGITKQSMRSIVQSVEYIRDYPLTASVSHHFRTTICAKYLNFEDVAAIAEHLGPESTYVLQYYTTHQTLDPSLADESYVVPYEVLVEWSKKLKPLVGNIYVSEV